MALLCASMCATARRSRDLATGHYEGDAEAGQALPRRVLRWAFEGIVIDHLTIARVAAGLGGRGTPPKSAVLAEASGWSSAMLAGSTACG